MAKHLSTTKSVLIALVAIVLLVLGITVSLLRPYYLKHQAIVVMKDAGGFVEKEPVGPEWLIDLQRKFSSEPHLYAEVYLINAKSCSYHDGKIPNEHLKCLSVFPNLVELGISNSSISDAGLVHLAELTNLKTLYLTRPPKVKHDTEKHCF